MVKCEKITDCKTNKKKCFCKYCIYNKNCIKVNDYYNFNENKIFNEIFKTANECGITKDEVKMVLSMFDLED